jgi:predicted dienelactone hydrolase
VRRFELFLLYGAAFAVEWPAVFGVRPRRGIVAATLLALFVLQLQQEGLRWQMIPLYGAVLGLAIGDILAAERRLDWARRISRGIFGLAGLGLTAVLPLVLPVPELPTPSGPEPVGTVAVEVVDPERSEVYGQNPAGPRRLMVQVWYPTEARTEAEPVPWSEDWDIQAPAMAARLGLPGWFLSHTRFTESHSEPSAPPAPGTFPVVVYSHGWTGFRTIAVNQIEALASNGFMVLAIDHTYEAATIRFPDDEIVDYDPAALPDPLEVGDEAYHDAIETLLQVLADDLITVVDALEEGESGPFGAISASADVTRLGVYGHTTGGGAAVSFCLQDERCDAVLGLDPWVEPIPDRVIAASATRPALYMRSDEWRGTENDAILRGIAERSTVVTYWVGVEGALQSDFELTPLLSPFAGRLGWTGPIPSGRVVPIVERYLVGFFDVYLLGTGTAALDTASFSEVSVEVIHPDQ